MISVHFQNTITLGAALVGILLAIPALLALFKAGRWKANAETAEQTVEVYREGREAYRQKADRLEDEKEGLLHLLAEQKARIAELEALPTQESVMKMIEAMDAHALERTAKAVRSVEEQMAGIERRAQERDRKSTERAQERHEMQMGVMNEIVRTLQKINGRG